MTLDCLNHVRDGFEKFLVAVPYTSSDESNQFAVALIYALFVIAHHFPHDVMQHIGEFFVGHLCSLSWFSSASFAADEHIMIEVEPDLLCPQHRGSARVLGMPKPKSWNRVKRVECRSGQRRVLLCHWRICGERIESLKALSITTSEIVKDDVVRKGGTVTLIEPVKVGRFFAWKVKLSDDAERYFVAWSEDLRKHSSVIPRDVDS